MRPSTGSSRINRPGTIRRSPARRPRQVRTRCPRRPLSLCQPGGPVRLHRVPVDRSCVITHRLRNRQIDAAIGTFRLAPRPARRNVAVNVTIALRPHVAGSAKMETECGPQRPAIHHACNLLIVDTRTSCAQTTIGRGRPSQREAQTPGFVESGGTWNIR